MGGLLGQDQFVDQLAAVAAVHNFQLETASFLKFFLEVVRNLERTVGYHRDFFGVSLGVLPTCRQCGRAGQGEGATNYSTTG